MRIINLFKCRGENLVNRYVKRDCVEPEQIKPQKQKSKIIPVLISILKIVWPIVVGTIIGFSAMWFIIMTFKNFK
jgi:hypothetical protein